MYISYYRIISDFHSSVADSIHFAYPNHLIGCLKLFDKRVIYLLAAGRTQSEIAKELGTSQGTVSKKLAKIKNSYKTEK